MPDLITVYDSEGKKMGICGSSCYEATKPDCDCICGGKNHGIGFSAAMAQTAEITETIIAKGTDAHNEAKDLKLVECQGTELDEDLSSHFFKKVCILPDKENVATLEGWVQALRKLKADAPMTIIALPPNTKGLPAGSYNLAILLEYIAGNLEGKRETDVEGNNDNSGGVL